MLSKAGVSFNKKPTGGTQFIIRKADGSAPKVVGEYVNDVFKGLKPKTSAHNKLIGTFEGEVEFADGTKEKGTYEFWGNCGSISNFRTATDPVPNCGDIASKLLRKVWQPIQRIKNKHPNDPMPKDAKLDFIAEIEDGRITNRNENGMSYLRDFVVTTEGELIVGKRHHFLANTKDVEAAGMIKVVNGKIRRLDNYSGHYFPSIKETEKFPLIFKELGLNIKGSTLQTWYLDEKNVLQSFEKVIHE